MSLTPTTTETVSGVVDADQSPGAFWNALATSDTIQQALVESVRELLAGTHHADREATLREAGVTAANGTFATVATSLDLAPEHPRHQEALETIARFGFEDTIMGSVPLEEIADGPVALLEAADQTPTVGVRVSAGFRDRRREHREQICDVIATLSDVIDVRLVATRLTQHWLATAHREDLPGVSDWCNSGRDGQSPAVVVDSALDELGPDSREVAILRTLADDSSGTLSYDQLYATFPSVKDSRIRQCCLRLAELGLVEPFGPDSDRMVDLLETGSDALAAFDAESGRQIELGERVSESPKSHNRPCNHANGMGGEDAHQPYDFGWLSPANHAAAAACGTAGSVTLVNGPVEAGESTGHDHTRYVRYDPDHDEAAVAVRATGALQHVVSVATALASPGLIHKALPEDRLESITLSDSVLRDARCIGSLSDDALEDPKTLQQALIDWGKDLEEFTTKLKRREYDDRDAFRSEIMRSAHGLAGSIVHLLDVVGVDVVREIRVPSGLNTNRLEGISKSIAKASAVQSRYGHYAAYRQLFETREDKRDQSIDVQVDAEDPFGDLIGGFVVRGPGVDRLRPHLETTLENDDDLVEDAPEFAINVTLREASRTDLATAATRILSPKNLSLTRETASILHGLTAAPHAATAALQQLRGEDYRRDLRPDELRYALSQIGPEHILPEFPTSVGAIVSTLFETTEPITQSELADRAGVSAQTIRNHRETLEAIGLLEVTDKGHRLAISTTEERDETYVPDVVTAESILEAADALLVGYLPPSRYGDPDDPLGGILFWPQDPWSLADHDDLGPWLELGARLAGADRPEETIVTMGPAIEQQPLPTADGRTEVAG